MQVSANWAWTALTQGEKRGEDGKVLAEGLFTRGAGTLRGSNMWLLGLQLVILKCKTKKKNLKQNGKQNLFQAGKPCCL